MKLLFVVHRSYPSYGGSEFNVKLISSELSYRGHLVHVLTDNASSQSYGNVQVITDRNALFGDYDWVIIHGSDMPIQNYALSNLTKMSAKSLYWMISRSTSEYGRMGFRDATKVGWGCSADWNHLTQFNAQQKACYLRYSMEDCYGDKGFKLKYGIDGHLILSGGGFSPHKRHIELASAFTRSGNEDSTLVLSGYHQTPPVIDHPRVKVMTLDRPDYLSALTESSLYVMNSADEGFGLVLLECMLNCVPWIATPVGGVPDLKEYGTIYASESELEGLLKHFTPDPMKIRKAHEHMQLERSVEQMGDDFVAVLI